MGLAIASILAGISSVAAALIAATASLAVALLTAWRGSVRLKRLEAEDTARVSYEYEARKRLYAVCEPLLFQAMDQAEDACSRILSLAKAARKDELKPDGSGWLARPQGYYFESTVYSLLAPVTTFSILQRRLTTIDLGLDESVRTKYEMLKLVFFSFSKDWELAGWGGAEGSLPYDRNRADEGEPERDRLLRESPQQYAPQGLYRAMIYLVAEALTPAARGAGGGSDVVGLTERCMTFGEFQREWDRAAAERSSSGGGWRLGLFPPPAHVESAMTPVFDSLADLLGGFHPERKPVLWRVLVTQYLLYRALSADQATLTPLTEEEIRCFHWREDADDAGAFREPVAIAEGFVRTEFETLRERLKR
jgi:hypothetical protein